MEAAFAAFGAKFFFALTFIIPVLLLKLGPAIIVSIIRGLSALSVLSYMIAKDGKENPLKVICEHLAIAVIVIILTNYMGNWISSFFG